MPYLHWETDSRRARFAEKTLQISQKYKRNELTQTPSPAGPQPLEQVRLSRDDDDHIYDDFHSLERAVDSKLRKEIRDNPQSKFSKTHLARSLASRALQPKTVLGQTLYYASVLREAMDCYQDERLLADYLLSDPPLHPRRTLDQSYYWNLKDTAKRDRDQVVYRGTVPRKGRLCSCSQPGCRHYQENHRKIPRILMVDQLWLWILDGSKQIQHSRFFPVSQISLTFQLPWKLDPHLLLLGFELDQIR
jgi:hypothetical protein